MVTVQFIKLEREEKALYLCRLAEKHFLNGERVLVVVNDENRAVTLDRFMWLWEKGAFLPHALDNGTVDCMDEPVVISTSEHNPNQAKCLIMGTPCRPEFMAHFERVYDFAEVYDPKLTEAARKRFRRYRDAGYRPSMG